jgi:hypothetical protein
MTSHILWKIKTVGNHQPENKSLLMFKAKFIKIRFMETLRTPMEII